MPTKKNTPKDWGKFNFSEAGIISVPHHEDHARLHGNRWRWGGGAAARLEAAAVRSAPIPCSPRRRVGWARRFRGARSPCGALQQGLQPGSGQRRTHAGGPGAGARRWPAWACGPGRRGRRPDGARVWVSAARAHERRRGDAGETPGPVAGGRKQEEGSIQESAPARWAAARRAAERRAAARTD